MYFFFCVKTKEKDTKKKKIPKRKSQDRIFSATLFLRFAKEKELASLKQLFLFNATLRSFALRCENEVGMPCGWLLG